MLFSHKFDKCIFSPGKYHRSGSDLINNTMVKKYSSNRSKGDNNIKVSGTSKLDHCDNSTLNKMFNVLRTQNFVKHECKYLASFNTEKFKYTCS